MHESLEICTGKALARDLSERGGGLKHVEVWPPCFSSPNRSRRSFWWEKQTGLGLAPRFQQQRLIRRYSVGAGDGIAAWRWNRGGLQLAAG